MHLAIWITPVGLQAPVPLTDYVNNNKGGREKKKDFHFENRVDVKEAEFWEWDRTFDINVNEK